MGTEPARLQQRAEAALGMAWGIERELGGGGMSRVFFIDDARLGRRIVLKVLHPDLAADVSARRVDREVRLAARLQHLHVVHMLTEVGTALGALAYLVPEHVTGDPAIDHCADLYALGMMAYELLVGSHPFTGRAHHAAVAAHLTEAPTPLSERQPVVAPSAAAVVMRLLEKHAADRPRNAAEVVRALDSVAAPGPHLAAPPRLLCRRWSTGSVCVRRRNHPCVSRHDLRRRNCRVRCCNRAWSLRHSPRHACGARGATQFRKEYSRGRLTPPTGGRFK